MISLFPRRLRDKLWPEPLPSLSAFEDQTVLVTGATGGLGLAAAVHFATFGATVILTSRSLSQGNVAKDHIEQRAGIIGQEKVHVMELNMSEYSSCLSFVDKLKRSKVGQVGLDVAVLNAGLINVDYVQSPEGWEQTIQVHTLSTTLLGLLLLDWMKQTCSNARKTPHMVFVTSRKHLLPHITNWAEYAAQGGILRHFSDEKNWSTGEVDPNYSESKLMLTYAVEHICQKALGPDGKADVIVNTVCPGLVNTDLGRSVTKLSWTMQLFVPAYFSLLGKTADYGARSYLIAALTSENAHGKYIQSIYSDDEYTSLSATNLTSDTAIEVKKLVWNEIIAELVEKVPALKV
ncbi:hypothetical protein L13192_12047 [Pyrenophora tritici-repentis]|nr:hypothetical protein L13192_12047 [Pyrenophora tritici-repentis]